jgi:hypothetical protein
MSWEEITNVFCIPWAMDANTDPKASSPNNPAWSIHVMQNIQAYTQNLWSKSNVASQIKYSTLALQTTTALANQPGTSSFRSIGTSLEHELSD